jgi:hypothetical protein
MAKDNEQKAIDARNRRKGPKVTDGKRRCRTEECDTILSMYNSDQYCAVHLRGILINSTSLTDFLPR